MADRLPMTARLLSVGRLRRRATPWLFYHVAPLDIQRFSGLGCLIVAQPKSGQPAEVIGGFGACGRPDKLRQPQFEASASLASLERMLYIN
jgi:hypothetical protein